MNITKLEKATKIYEQIKILDSQIIQIDKFAMLVANGEIKSSFELKIEDIGKKKEDEEKISFDEDGSLIKGVPNSSRSIFSAWGFVIPFSSNEIKVNENEYFLKNELSINATMSILGVLLYEKQAQRQLLLNDLEKIGIDI